MGLTCWWLSLELSGLLALHGTAALWVSLNTVPLGYRGVKSPGTNLPPDLSHLCGHGVVSWRQPQDEWMRRSFERLNLGPSGPSGFMVQDETTHRINHVALDETGVIRPVPREVVSELFLRA